MPLAAPVTSATRPENRSVVAHGSQRKPKVSAHGLRSQAVTTPRCAATRSRVDARRGVALDDVTLDAIRAGELGGGRDARDAGDASSAGGGRARGGPDAARREPRACGRARGGARRSAARDLHGAAPGPRDRGGARGVGVAARRLRRRRDRRVRPRGGRGLRGARTARGWRSRRFASRATRELHLEQLVSPLPELGLVAANGPNDPEPELVVVDGVVTRMDGRAAADFDVIDRFVVAHGLDLDVAAEAMALDEVELARMLVDVERSARRARASSRAGSRRRSSRASSGCSTRSS